MKKILCLFGALSLLLTSCSSNDDSDNNNTDADTVLLKKTITTDSEGDAVTSIYTYDGNKIVSIIDDSGDVNEYYTYTGNLITKLEYKFPDGSIDQVNTYTYNADGTVTAKSYGGDNESQTDAGTVITIKFVNGEVTEIISPDASYEEHVYTYDTKNNPMKNVIGMDKIAFIDGEGNGVKYNILTDTSEDELWTNSTFTYNDNGYPTKEVDTGTDSLGNTEFFY